MGIPILYPWANRLSANDVWRRRRRRHADSGHRRRAHRRERRADPRLLAAYPGWRAEQVSDQKLTAELDFGDSRRTARSFPFPHLLTLTVTLADRTLTVKTTVTPTSDKPVPLCFGFHPYLQLPVCRASSGYSRPGHASPYRWTTGASPPEARRLGRGTATAEDRRVRRRLRRRGRRVGIRACRAATAGSRSRSNRVIPQRNFSPRRKDDSSLSSRWPPRRTALRRGSYRPATPGTPDVARFSITVT